MKIIEFTKKGKELGYYTFKILKDYFYNYANKYNSIDEIRGNIHNDFKKEYIFAKNNGTFYEDGIKAELSLEELKKYIDSMKFACLHYIGFCESQNITDIHEIYNNIEKGLKTFKK